jgi:hypothetical protein
MADIRPGGQVVRVTAMGLGGAEPMQTTFVVAEGDPEKAQEIVKAASSSPDDQVKALYALPSGVIEAFHLQPGQFKPCRP